MYDDNEDVEDDYDVVMYLKHVFQTLIVQMMYSVSCYLLLFLLSVFPVQGF